MSADTETPSETVPVEAAADASSSLSEGKRVYVGNLPFKTNYQELRGLFEDYNLLSVTIPKAKVASKQGGFFYKKLGYAFAEFGSKEEAERVVNELDEKVLNDRKLSIKLAKTERKPKKERDEKEVQKDQADNKNDKSEEKSNTNGAAAAKKERRPKRAPAPDSKDTVFLANVPVGTTVEEIQELFVGFDVKEVKTVNKDQRTIRRKGGAITQEPRTLAFVRFADETVQQKAIAEFDGKKFKDVDLSVKVATELVSGGAEADADADKQEGTAEGATAAA
jgi:RNA recognition motif-containing protein